MVENNTITDTVASLQAPAAKVEHQKALQALQSELDYHRRAVGNNTYMDNIVSYVYDGGKSESLQKLELAYKNEKENPNSLSREDVTKLIKEDQKRLNSSYVDFGVGMVGTGLAFLGSRGKLAATALVTLDTVHPNDSLGQQALETVAGLGIGSLAGSMFDKGGSLKNQWLGASMQVSAYPLLSSFGRIQWPNGGSGERPDVDKIYNARVEPEKVPPFYNLKPIATEEWSKFKL